MAKIYVSSSWTNHFQSMLVEELRQRGHEVYDFRHPNGRNDRNVWDENGVSSQLFEGGISGFEMKKALADSKAQKRFREHFAAMRDADTCVLFLPCGRSAHIEAGYMKGLGKRVFVFGSAFDIIKPELMYLTFDGFFCLYDELFQALDKSITDKDSSQSSCPGRLKKIWNNILKNIYKQK